MSNKKTSNKLGKSAIAATLLVSAVAPIAVAAEIPATATDVTAAINALSPSASDYVEKVAEVKTAYEKLTAIELAKITSTVKTKYTNHTKAVEVVVAINELDSVETIQAYTDASELAPAKEIATTVRAAYVALNSTQRSYVKNLTTLTAYETAITNQTKYFENLIAMDGFLTALDNLEPVIAKGIDYTNVTVTEFRELTEDETITASEVTLITTARAEYAKLTSAVKQAVKAEDLKKLTDLEAQVKLQTSLQTTLKALKITEFTASVNALDPSAEDYIEQVAEIEEAYNNLDEATLAGLTSTTKSKYNNHLLAASVAKAISESTILISDIEAADADALASIKEDVAELRALYTALNSTARSYVKNIATVTANEAAITTRQAVLDNAAALSGWETAIGAVKSLETYSFTDANPADYETTDKYSEEQIIAIENARTEYSKLTTTLKRLVSAENLEKLAQLEAAVKEQEVFKAAYDILKAEEDAAAEAEAALEAEIQAWKDAVIALPADVADFTALGDKAADEYVANFEAAKYKTEQLTAISDARITYTNLSAKASESVLAEEYQKLVAHETQVRTQKVLQAEVDAAKAAANQAAADQFTASVTALANWTVATDYQAAVDAIDFDALSDDVKALVSAATQTTLANHQAAAPVAVLVAGVTPVATIQDDVDIEATDAQTTLDGFSASVEEAREAYDALTTPEQKALVTNLATLTASEDAVAAKQTAINNVLVLKPFKDAMAVLGDTVKEFGTYTFKSELANIDTYDEAEIKAAREAYGALDETLQTEVSDLEDVLVLHEAALLEQKALLAEVTAYQAAKADVDAVEALIDGLGTTVLTIPSLTDYVPVDEATDDKPASTLYSADVQQPAIEAAAQAYEDLGDAQEFVDSAKKAQLDLFTASLNAQIQLLADHAAAKLADIKLAIEGWSTPTAATLADFITEVTDTKADFDALSDTDKASIGTENVKKLNNYVAAMAVAEQITELSDAYLNGDNTDPDNPIAAAATAAEMDSYIAAAQAARDAYDLLTSAQQPLVINVADLRAYEIDVAAKKQEFVVAEALADWKTAYVDIEDIEVITFDEASFDYNNFKEADGTYYTTDELGFITAARSAFDAIETEAFKAEVDETELKQLTDLEKSVADFERLKDIQETTEQAIAAAIEPFETAMTDLTTELATPYDYTDKTVADYKTALGGEYTTAVRNLITTARNALTTLEAGEYASHVDTELVTVLEAYEASLDKYDDFVHEEANQDEINDKLQPWEDAVVELKKITAKGYTTTINADNVNGAGFEAHLPADVSTIEDARDVYDALVSVTLSDGTVTNLQSKISADDLAVLTTLEAEVTAYNAALAQKATNEKGVKKEALKDAINAINLANSSYLVDVDAAKLLYMELTTDVKTEFNKEYPTEAAAYTNHVAIARVVTLVELAPTVAEINATTTKAALTPLEASIKAARTAYNALTEDQKGIYADTDLVAIESAYSSQLTKLSNKEAISSWTAIFALAPTPIALADITATSYTDAQVIAIENLQDVFGELEDVQDLIPTEEKEALQLLLDGLEKQQQLAEAAEIASQLADFRAALTAITFTAIEFDLGTIADFKDATKYTPEQLQLIQAAVDEYDALDEELLAHLTDAEDTKYNALKDSAAEQAKLQADYEKYEATESAATKIATFMDGLNALNPSATTYLEDFAEVKTAYEALTPDLLAKLTSTLKTKYSNHALAVPVVEAIAEVTAAELLEEAETVADLTALENDVKAAQTAYLALNSTARSFVKNYSSVATTLTAITAKKTALQNAEAIKTWTDAVGNLPAVLPMDNYSYKDIENAVKYAASEITIVETLRGIYDGFSTTVRSYVDQDEYNQLVAVEAAIKRQKELLTQAANATAIAAALSDWEAAYALLPEAKDMTGITVETINNFKYPDGTEANVAAAREKYEAIAAAYKSFVTPADLQNLVDLEQSLITYKKVLAEAEKANAADAAGDVIEKLTLITLGSADFVEKALELKNAYDDLSDAAKAQITSANRTKIINYGGAAGVLDSIATITTTVEDIAAMDEAELTVLSNELTIVKNAYLALNSTARSYVTTYSTLTALQTAVSKQTTKLANEALLVTWNAAVDALPGFENISATMTAATYAETYDVNEKAAITAARAEYNKLSSAVRAVVDASELQLLVNLEKDVKHQTTLGATVATNQATAFTALVNALNPSATTYTADVDAMLVEYGKLSDVSKSKLTSTIKTKMTNHTNAANVVTLIKEIVEPTTDDGIADFKQTVAAARTAYTALNSTARSYVKNYSTLTAHEAVTKLL